MSLYATKINGAIVICEPSEDGLTYLLPMKWWNPKHIYALIAYVYRGQPADNTVVCDGGESMLKYTPEMLEILDKVDPTFGREIACDEGWWPLISELHHKICELDPDYRIYQIKEKFGTLRFYCAPSNPDIQNQINALVREYELLSSQTCEITGGPGEIMFRSGVYKTLSKSFIDEGWKPASSEE